MEMIMKNNKVICLIIFVLLGLKLHAQVTIGSSDPPHKGAMLELKSSDKGFLGPRVQLENTSTPDPIKNPAKGLLVFNIGDNGTGDQQVKKERFYIWSGTEWVEFLYEYTVEGEIVQTIEGAGIPRSAIFHLNGTDKIDNRNTSNPVLGMYNVMEGQGLGGKSRLYFKETKNETNGKVTLVIDTWKNSYLRFKKGVYSITFAYQFIPSTYAYPTPSTPLAACTASSYFVDFPLERSGITGDRARIHNVAYHATGVNSHHGGSISYVVKIEQDDLVWEIRLGAGQSGSNCNYPSTHPKKNQAIAGFSLVNDNTFVLVSRIGD